jgi:uncharacterized protein YbaP (TraB family)
MNRTLLPLITILLCIAQVDVAAQKKYQGLLWEISGNGMTNPSYLYGTMHVSNKVAFYLGEPFFDALERVDRVSLELEPELWFDEVLGGDIMSTSYNLGNTYGGLYGEQLNPFEGKFKVSSDVNTEILNIFKQSPEVLNQMLFRFYDASGNFEEDTWLDMFIYQSAKKMGKETLGLETFRSSMEILAKSQEEMQNAPAGSNDLSYKDRIEMNMEIEAAYRKGDLDKLDSLTRMVSPAAFIKYILIERNRNFVAGMDTLMRQKPMFTGVGAAHLPGAEGCIEMLRERGYQVRPVQMGRRDSKQKQKLTDMVLKRPQMDFRSGDGVMRFESPGKVYTLALGAKTSGTVSMDVANGITFIVDRLMHFSAFNGHDPDYLRSSLDSMLYEVIPGEIISKKNIFANGHPGFDILHRTRRGDLHRAQVIFMPDEVIIARLSGTGDKIKKAPAFFNSLNVVSAASSGWSTHESLHGSLKFDAPGRPASYADNQGTQVNSDFYYQVFAPTGDCYFVHRTESSSADFLDEVKYELDLMSRAFKEDLNVEETGRRWRMMDGRKALVVEFSGTDDRSITTAFLRAGLSYYAFSSTSSIEGDVKRFFDSIRLEQEKYQEFFHFADSLTFFSSSLPWKKDDSGIGALAGGYLDLSNNDPYGGYSRSIALSPPGSSEEILLEYERLPPYSFAPDKEEHEELIDELFTDSYDLFVVEKHFEWNDTGYYAEYQLGDTMTARRIEKRIWVRGESSHLITTSFDSLTGESPFVQRFIEDLVFLPDTLAGHDFVTEPSARFLRDIRSTDTLLFKRANSRLDVTNGFRDESKYHLFRSLVESPPAMADEGDKENYLTYYGEMRFVDRSMDNIHALADEFRANSDSAGYQLLILENLVAMQTKPAMEKAKELLLWEAPIGIHLYPNSGLFALLRDSLELTSTLFPELLDLTSYDEYEEPVIMLLSTLLDSGLVNKNLYRDRIAFFAQEAKVEFRRMNSSSGESGRYSIDDNSPSIYKTMMEAYWNLLYPFRKEPLPQAVFERSAASSKPLMVERYHYFLKEKGVPVPNDVCELLLTNEDLLRDHFMLQRLGRTDLFPDTIDLERHFVDELIGNDLGEYAYGEDVEVDSVVFLEMKQDSIRQRSYNTYHYKYYRQDGSGNRAWKIAVVMVQQFEGRPDPPFTYISASHFFDAETNIDTQLAELEFELVVTNRRNGYGASDDYYDNFF